MCGILGFASVEEISENTVQQLKTGLQRLTHRGPDGEGYFKNTNCYLGHKRLSIIDLSESANQPIQSSTANAQIIFNGEIYNYGELKENLTLRTSSDTEVLLEGYLKYGVPFFKKIKGIYAFAILDNRGEEEKLILLRDPSGIKPLYYHYADNNCLAFSSEIKAITPLIGKNLTINEEILKAYLHLGYVVEPNTIYNEISCAEPGKLYTYHVKQGKLDTLQLLEYTFTAKNKNDATENLNKTEELLKQAASRNLISDVEINIALSGGIDSSLLYALCNKKQPTTGITVRANEEKYDETDVATQYAEKLKAPHLIVSTDEDNKLQLLNNLIKHFDQPYADSSFIPFYFLSKASSQYTKVLIGGDSGDEIQNGYSGYGILPTILKLNKNPLLKTSSKAVLNLAQGVLGSSRKRELKKLTAIVGAKNNTEALFNYHSWFPANKQLYPNAYPFKFNTDNIYKVFTLKQSNKSLYSDIEETYFRKRMQSDYLRKADMMSMYNSLEFRVPMLDEDLVEFSLSIPYKQKSTSKEQKIILKKLHSKIFPIHTTKRKKTGFTIPLDTWLGVDDLNYIKEYLKRKEGIIDTYIKTEYVDILFDTLKDKELQQYCSRASAYQRILILYSLQLWYLEIYKEEIKN